MTAGNFVRLTKDLSFNDVKYGNISKPQVYKHIVTQWIFKPIDRLMESYIDSDNGMAILALELMFFEPQGEYLTGNRKLGSKAKFCFAFDDFKNYLIENEMIRNDISSLTSESIYKWARCGLFHAGRLSDELLVDAVNSSPFSLSVNPIIPGWLVNPWKMKEQIQKYLEKYIKELDSNHNRANYKNFEKTYTKMIENPMNKYCTST